MPISNVGVDDELCVRPFAGALGAEIEGVDLAEPLGANLASAIRQALLDHGVVVFRNQRLEPPQLKQFASALGEFNYHPYVQGLINCPEVFAIIKEPDDSHHFGNGWHSDLAYTELPAMATALYAVEVPSAGGDTLFASAYKAYDSLSTAMQTMLEPLRVVYSNAATYGPAAQRFDNPVRAMQVSQVAEIEEVAHPLVRLHPETGRKGLYLSPIHAVRIEDMTVAESQPLIDFLAAHAARPEHTCRVRWQPGTLSLWDNRCTMHYAIDDFRGHRRVMNRVTLQGDKPQAA